MLGYTAATIERKAEKRGMKPHEYELYLVQKRSTRNDRKRAERNRIAAEKAAQAKAQGRFGSNA